MLTKVKLFDTNSHWGRNVGPSFCTGKQTPELGIETSGITIEEEIQSQPSAGKVIFTVFWDSQGVIVEHYLERGATVNSVRYSEMLSTELKTAIRTKRRGLLSSGVLLLHDNARPHTAIHNRQTPVKLGFTVFEHPA